MIGNLRVALFRVLHILVLNARQGNVFKRIYMYLYISRAPTYSEKVTKNIFLISYIQVGNDYSTQLAYSGIFIFIISIVVDLPIKLFMYIHAHVLRKIYDKIVLYIPDT